MSTVPANVPVAIDFESADREIDHVRTAEYSIL
jgi:hypothetical protein